MGNERKESGGGAGPSTCEECGATGALPTRVRFKDEKERTIELCERCVSDFRSADLVEDVARLDRDSPDSTG